MDIAPITTSSNCVADTSATQLFPVYSVPYISIESPLKIEAIEGPFYKNADFWIGFVGVLISIILSIVSLWYAKNQAKKARDESINDLFWFREIIYPRSIAPLLNLIDSFSNQIPVINIAKSKRKSSANKCLREWQELRGELNYKLTYLGLWNKTIYTKVTDNLDLIEDAITNYCYLLQSNKITTLTEYNLCIKLLSDLQAYLFTDVQKAHLENKS